MRDTAMWCARGAWPIVALGLAAPVAATGAQVTPVRPPIEAPAGRPVRAAVAAPIWGVADLHVHQFNNLGFGGVMFHGAPFGAPAHALHDCAAAHGPLGVGDVFGSILTMLNGAGGWGHPVGGHSGYEGWPRWNTYTHQQVHADWLKRALDGGLKLIVMLAGNNPALCEKLARAPGHSCDDMWVLERQIAAAKAMEHGIDKAHGGPGRGWYRIVYTPQQARDAIARGQLAVVLGAELPTIFCEPARAYACDLKHLRAAIAKYRALGLRQLNPVHNADNAFGGSAVYTDVFNVTNKRLSGDWFKVRDCSAGPEYVKFRFNSIGGALAHLGTPLREHLARLFGEPSAAPDYWFAGQCNVRGLTARGEVFLRELMTQKMLIDVDHMSWRTADRALQLAEEHRYPVLSSHTAFLDISAGPGRRNEAQKRRTDVEAITRLGGIVAPLPFQGLRGETHFAQSSIPNDCSNSSQTFAQAYLYAVSVVGGPVAFGSDINGFAGMPSPRFGPERCNNGHGANGVPGVGPGVERGGRVTYPFPVHGVPGRTLGRSVAGTRRFDINADGFAHIGMFPDFIQELKVQGMTDAQLEPLFRSAEAYIRMWERVEASGVPAQPLQP